VNSVHQRRNFEEDSDDIVVMCCGGCEITHIGAPVHKGAGSRVRVVMYRGQRADGSRKEKRAAGKPERQSGEPVSNKFIRSIIRNLTGTTRYHRNRVMSLSLGSKEICRKA